MPEVYLLAEVEVPKGWRESPIPPILALHALWQTSRYVKQLDLARLAARMREAEKLR